MTVPEFDYRMSSEMRRFYPQQPEVGPEAQAQIDALSAQYDELAVEAERGDGSEDVEARLAELEASMEALKGEPVYAATDIAAGGAFVSLGYDGGVRVERGFIRKADEAPGQREDRDGDGDAGSGGREASTALPEKLVAQLTAYRTLALWSAVAARPDVAFVAVVHALAVPTFYVGHRASCLDLTASSAFLANHTPGIDESALGRAFGNQHTALATGLPEDVQDLWNVLQGFTQEKLMQLLAHCAALTIDCVVRVRGVSSPTLKHADALAQAVSLDMAGHWQPTAANYLGQVTKAVIVEAVRDGVSEQAASQLADLKKSAMAEAAERLLADKGWLPMVLRLPPSQDNRGVAVA